ETLEREISLRETLYETGEKIFHSAGGFAPTMGIIGTIMGMAGVLKGISDINSIGTSVSTAFVSTLYGVCSANILWIPFANKIKFRLEKESRINHMILEGILSIKHGNNSKIIREKLNLPLLERMR
ncbi:MAG TPA: MotA/TolQ/ExbB proton channel family protein, partial [Clostridia bacterium]